MAHPGMEHEALARPVEALGIVAEAGREGQPPQALADAISPLVRVMLEMLRRMVVLPAPFAPSSATTSPFSTVRETPCNARIGP